MTQALGNITSANSVLVLGVEQLYPVGVQLTNFATDQMLTYAGSVHKINLPSTAVV